MPTEDRLDDAAEERIEEQLPCLHWPVCRTHRIKRGIARAAIRADREARGNLFAPAEKLCCEAVGCPSCDAVLRVTVLTATTDGGIGAISEVVEPGKLPAEIAHADRLAEGMKTVMKAVIIHREASKSRKLREYLALNVIEPLRAALREHEERRK